MFLDPTGTINVALPPGWAFDPISSSLTDLVFTDWALPEERQVLVRVVPAHVGAGNSDDDWEAAVRARLPAEVTRAERREGPVVLVELPGREGLPDRRLALVRGPRIDTLIEQMGVPVGGALSTPVLVETMKTLDIPANRRLAERREQSEWSAAMETAHKAYFAGHAATAASDLAKARAIAKEAWLHSLTGRPIPEIPAAMAEAEAALALVNVTGSALFLNQGTLTLHRCRNSLLASQAPSTLVHLERLDGLLGRAIQLHGEMTGSDAPENPIAACLARSQMLYSEFKTMLEGDHRKIGGPWAMLAVEEAMTAVAFARRRKATSASALPAEFVARLAAQGITDQAHQIKIANEVIEIMALNHLVAAGSALYAARAFAGLDADRAMSANWLLSARRLAELSPSREHDQGLVLALSGHAGALVALADEPSLADADQFLAEAEAILDRHGDEGELRAQVCLNQSWLRYTRRQLDGSLAVVDRAITAAKRSKSDRIERAARSLKSQFLCVAGRTDEAVAMARQALVATHDDAASTHHLNLAIALHRSGKHHDALEEVRAGLAAAFANEPLGGEVLHLLFVGADVLQPVDAVASLATTEAAEAVLDARRQRVGDAADRVGFDDAIRHREVAATLVQRRLDINDVLGALATADRHRARSLIEAMRSPSEGAVTDAGEERPPASDAPFTEQVGFITRLARATLARHGVPQPLDGASLAEAVATSGRTAILFHPSDTRLFLFVIRPGQPVGITVRVAAVPVMDVLAITDALRTQLGVTVAARAARGEMPRQSIEDLAAAFVDDDDLEEADAELDRLRRELHDALFSEVLSLLIEGEPVVVVPYRELAVVPLAVLTGADGRSLAERHPLSVLPSLASLDSLAKPKSALARALVVGDPTVSPDIGLAPLLGATAEAKHIHGMLADAGIATKLLLGPDASEAAFRANARGARVVHLACHAALRQPVSASPLFLTPAPPDDGLLLPAEIADLRLDGALVVLAACQSGLGRVTADGVLGLGRAFMRAGARALMLSLWRVNDTATAHLMKELYAGLLGTAPELDGPLDLATAARRAQVATRAEISSDPSAWGAWQVVGDGGWRLA
jgi:CHAT domain-containing protein